MLHLPIHVTKLEMVRLSHRFTCSTICWWQSAKSAAEIWSADDYNLNKLYFTTQLLVSEHLSLCLSRKYICLAQPPPCTHEEGTTHNIEDARCSATFFENPQECQDIKPLLDEPKGKKDFVDVEVVERDL